jgi:hypothetical protein
MQSHALIVIARPLQVRTRQQSVGIAALFQSAVGFMNVSHVLCCKGRRTLRRRLRHVND